MLGKSPAELTALAADCGLKPFVGRQLAEWLYVKRVTGWDAMTNISKLSKARLQENCELGTSAPIASVTSRDGTSKYLFAVNEKESVEAVVIPDGCTAIASRAFAGMDLLEAVIPASVVSIAPDAFENCPSTLWLVVEENSYADSWADGRFRHRTIGGKLLD